MTNYQHKICAKNIDRTEEGKQGRSPTKLLKFEILENHWRIGALLKVWCELTIFDKTLSRK